MIPTKTNDITVSGNLNGDKIAMGVHAQSLQKLIGILTDLYSDPVAAIIREYSTNAVDSHIASGQTRPVEVSLPSPLSPFFRVKDFGLGMSVDDVRDVYSQYGASTKDKSNDFNGMLGLGSKSALTYTSQFNVVATRGGVKATVVVSRAADGTGTMEVVDTVSTTDPNGVEIIIPVKFGTDFEKKARKFYSFWKPGTVLVNGKEPSLINGNKVAPDIYSVQGLDTDYIVQGNVAYPVGDGGLYEQSYYKDFGVVAYVPNGAVSFAPSREALMYDSVTKAEVVRIREEFKEGLAASIQADIDASLDAFEALTRFHKWKNMLGHSLPSGLSYKTQPVPTTWDLPLFIYEPSAYRNQTTSHRRIGYQAIMGDVVIVTDFTPDGTSASHKAKLRSWADENDVDADKFLLVMKKFGGMWTDGVETVSWDDVKTVKINHTPAARGGARGKQSYKVWTKGYWLANDDLKPLANVYYVSPKEKFSAGTLESLTNLEPDAMIVMLGRNRWDKFLRAFPSAKPLVEMINTYKGTCESKLTVEDKTILGMSSDMTNSLKRFDSAKVNDPKVVDMINLVRRGLASPGINYYNRVRSLESQAGYSPTPNFAVAVNPLKKYPLIPQGWNASSRASDHEYLYINAAFAATN